MAKVNYIVGDATNPKKEGNKIIVHICNDIGGWGKGFVMAISKDNPKDYFKEKGYPIVLSYEEMIL